MYKISSDVRRCILANDSLVGYSENEVTEEIERNIAATLPLIKGMVPGLSPENRLSLFSATAASSLAEFIKTHGDAFGCDTNFDTKETKSRQGMEYLRSPAIL